MKLLSHVEVLSVCLSLPPLQQRYFHIRTEMVESFWSIGLPSFSRVINKKLRCMIIYGYHDLGLKLRATLQERTSSLCPIFLHLSREPFFGRKKRKNTRVSNMSFHEMKLSIIGYRYFKISRNGMESSTNLLRLCQTFLNFADTTKEEKDRSKFAILNFHWIHSSSQISHSSLK